MSTRRTFTEEYRREAARLAIESDRPVAQTARELGIGESLLGKWVKKEQQRHGTTAPTTPNADTLDESERTELARLRREVQELRVDNEFLGKAAAFFASKPHRKNGMS